MALAVVVGFLLGNLAVAVGSHLFDRYIVG